jgi:hypothetical protein
MTEWTRDPGPDGASNWFRFFLGPQPDRATETRVFNRSDDVAATIAGTLTAQLPIAELFFVSAEMTELARHAADTLADYRLHPEDLPAQVGTLVYAEPPVASANDHHEGVTMVTWGPGRGGLWVHRWARTPDSSRNAHLGRKLAILSHREALDRAERSATRPLPTPDTPPTSKEGLDYVLAGLLPNLRRAPIPPSFTGPCGYDWRGLTPMEYTDMNGWPGDISDGTATDDPDAGIALERTILATWLLMGQTLVRSEQLTAPRAARRRIARQDPTLDPAVRYIDLRRARTEPADRTDDTAPGRRYRHRWIVRGHWRNQYYPSRGDHRPIWIDPHLAGPEGKPLLGGERVNVLRR